MKYKLVTEIYSFMYALFVGEPSSVEEALSKLEWWSAMEEMLSISKNNTCELMEFPAGKNVNTLKWIFKNKISSRCKYSEV